MQATGDFAADDAGSGESRDDDQRRAAEDDVLPRRRDPWTEAPNYGPSDDRFSIQVNHGGFFCGVGKNRTYLDRKVDLFDELSRWSFSCSHLDYILKELGYNTGDRSLRVYWCKPGCTVGDGLVAIKWEKDAYLMKTCAAEEKNLIVYVDHVNLLEKQRWDDAVLERVALPAVISPSKHVKKRRMEDDEQTKNAAKDFDYDFDEDDDQFKKHVDEDVTDSLVAKASLKFVSLPEQDIGEEEELELPEEMNGGLTYKWKTFNKMTDMHNPTFKVGMVFSDVKELRAAIAMYCVTNRRQLKKKRNNSIRVEVGCRPKCNWKLIATKQTRKDGSFVVTKLFDKHECERVWEVKELTAPMIAEEYLDETRDNENLSLKSFAKKHIDHVDLDSQFDPSELDDSMINQLNQEVPTIIFDEEEPFPEESAFVASYRESIPASRATSDGMAVLRGGGGRAKARGRGATCARGGGAAAARGRGATGARGGGAAAARGRGSAAARGSGSAAARGRGSRLGTTGRRTRVEEASTSQYPEEPLTDIPARGKGRAEWFHWGEGQASAVDVDTSQAPPADFS
ncbi:hypothetical protein ACQ4PT_033336 [Festuca glaucescens]